MLRKKVISHKFGKIKMKKRGVWILLIAVLFLVVSFFFDKPIFDSIVLNGNVIFDVFFGWMSHFGSLFVVMLVVTSLFLWEEKKRDWIPILWSSFIISSILSAILKLLVGRLRPYGIVPFSFLGIVNYSFPSMHAAAAFSLLPILNKKFSKLKWFWILFAVFVSYSRIYLGLHYLSDVIAGAIIGYIVGFMLVYSEEKYAIFKLSMVDVFEFRRQIFHICFGLLIVVLINFDVLDVFSLAIFIIIGIMLSLLSRQFRIPMIHWFLSKFEREHQLTRLPGRGVISYLIGALIVLLLFDKNIAMASIMILALGDSVSHFTGQFGRIRHPFNNKKFLEGAIAGFLVAWLGATLFVNVWYAFLGSLIAMIVEGFEIKFGREQLDDNIVMPLVAGFIIWLVSLFF